jgi:hypothetical protein
VPDELDDYFCCMATPGGHVFKVGRVRWDDQHTPVLEWITSVSTDGPVRGGAFRAGEQAATSTRNFRCGRETSIFAMPKPCSRAHATAISLRER